MRDVVDLSGVVAMVEIHGARRKLVAAVGAWLAFQIVHYQFKPFFASFVAIQKTPFVGGVMRLQSSRSTRPALSIETVWRICAAVELV